MRKLWGRLSSVNVQKVVWCLDELGLDYERVEAGGAHGVVTTPEYLAKNPNGLIPVLEEDGFTLWESNAIVRYLAAGRPEAGLWPSDPRARADCDRWMDWQATTATPALRDAFHGLVRTKPEARDLALIERSVQAAAKVAAILDRHLTERPYVAGSAFTTADIALGPHAHRWFRLPIERPRLPALEAWYGRVIDRPGARAMAAEPLR